MGYKARTSTRAASVGVGAACGRLACGGAHVTASLRARASSRAWRSGWSNVGRLGFGCRGVDCGHRRLTTHSSGRATRAAKFKR
jgi:hypothetical protein